MAEERVQRRLAAILAADVVGYSRLVERDEAGTLAALRERRKSILQPRAVEHRGPTYGVFHGHNGQSENREFDSSRVATNPGRGRHRPFHNSYWAHQLILMGGVSPPLVRETRTLLGVRPSRAANIAGRVESAYQIGRT